MIYVSSPYTHNDSQIREKRYLGASDYVKYLIRRGLSALSPIVYGHPIVSSSPELGSDIGSWRDFCMSSLEGCDQIHVLMLNGWRQSTGIAEEITRASEISRSRKMEIYFINPKTYESVDISSLPEFKIPLPEFMPGWENLPVRPLSDFQIRSLGMRTNAESSYHRKLRHCIQTLNWLISNNVHRIMRMQQIDIDLPYEFNSNILNDAVEIFREFGVIIERRGSWLIVVSLTEYNYLRP